jgi:TRAP-type transport system periplasmic protein
MKTLLKTILGGAAAALMAGHAALAADYQMVMTMQLQDQKNPIYQAFEYIKQEVEKRSDGRIEVKFFPGGVLGGDREIAESVTLGDVQLTSMSTSPVVAFVPELAVFDLPYIFPHDPAVLQQVLLKSEFTRSLDGYMEKKGFRLAGFFNAGFRQLTTAKTPVHSVADIENAKLRIRVQENPFHIELWKLLGAAPTPIAYTELYGALQQGVVDGQENPYVNILSSKFYEVQGYLTETSHILLANVNLMDAKWYNSLPDDLKKVVDDVIAEAMDTQWKAQNAALEEQKAELAKHMEMIQLTPEQLAEFQSRTAPMVDKIRASIGNELVDGLLAAINKAQN